MPISIELFKAKDHLNEIDDTFDGFFGFNGRSVVLLFPVFAQVRQGLLLFKRKQKKYYALFLSSRSFDDK